MQTNFQTFEREVVFVEDGDSFYGCKFVDCDLRVPAGSNVTIEDCVFQASPRINADDTVF